MKKLIFTLLIMSQGGIGAQTLAYMAPYISVGRYSGEVEFNQYFFWSPVGPQSRPGLGLIYGRRYDKRVSVEIYSDFSLYSGNSKYSNPNNLQNLSGSLEGIALMLGASVHRHFENGMELGMGLNYGFNRFVHQTQGASKGVSQESQNGTLVFRVGKQLWRFRNKNEVVFRYVILYNLSDNWDRHEIGILSDFISVGQLVWVVPVQNLKSNDKGGRRGIRSKRFCPGF
jgi:hypothetical protein